MFCFQMQFYPKLSNNKLDGRLTSLMELPQNDLDLLLFAHHRNRPTTDVVFLALHSAVDHLINNNTLAAAQQLGIQHCHFSLV